MQDTFLGLLFDVAVCVVSFSEKKRENFSTNVLFHVPLFEFPKAFCLSLCSLSHSLTFTPSSLALPPQVLLSDHVPIPSSFPLPRPLLSTLCCPVPFSRLAELDALTGMVPENLCGLPSDPSFTRSPLAASAHPPNCYLAQFRASSMATVAK